MSRAARLLRSARSSGAALCAGWRAPQSWGAGHGGPDAAEGRRQRPAYARRATPLALLSALLVSAAPAPASAPTPAPAPRIGGLPVLTPGVVARHAHDPAAFTEGLELSGGVLYEGTGLEGQSEVRRGPLGAPPSLRRALTVPGGFGEGISVLRGTLYQLTWQNGVALTYDAQTLRETGRMRYSGEGWGLTNDGRSLIMSNGSSTLVWRDPRTFAVTRRLNVTAGGVPVTRLNELEWVNGTMYANVWLTSRVARIDARTGKVTAWIELGTLAREAAEAQLSAGQTPTFDDVANGLAYNSVKGTLLVTGKRWPLLFEVRVPGLEGQAAGR